MNPAPDHVAMDSPDHDEPELQEMEVNPNPPPVVPMNRTWQRASAGGLQPLMGAGLINRVVGGDDEEDEDDDDDEEEEEDDDEEPDDDLELVIPPNNQYNEYRRSRSRKHPSPNNNEVNPLADYRSRSSAPQEPKISSSTKENGEVAMEEEDDDARSEGTFSYTVDNISKLKETALSPPYFVRNLPWKIMVMQRSQPGSDKTLVKSLGFFLQCNGDSDSSSWSCNAVADLRMLKRNGEEPFSRKINHLFYSKENDWGFSHFVTWADILDPEKGFIKDDSITLEVHVTADAPHGVSWDSKKHTGYVGLKNQGATCYMNSLLQVLYFTNRLRKAVYKMPTESDDSARSVPLALQRVFYELQFTDKPVGTKKLTKSFGWETLDSFMQHDVQEFLRVLLDNLESKMKRTSVEGTIPKLFEGKMISYIKCLHVNYSSSRTEPFYDIQLNVKGKKNIYESFKDYIEVETLEGENRYDAGQLGMQDAVKGVQFTQFPPVLYLHLMRFQYDPLSDTNVKINDRFEFPYQLDLGEFLKSPEETPATYTLHAVLVHSGDNHGGHYVVFINPRGDGKWCKFDDDVVSKCSKIEAIDHNFGGNDDEMSIGVKHCTNAYMLVYIRDSTLAWVLADVTEGDIPGELSLRINEEKRLETARRKERNETHQFMSVNVVTEDDFVGHQLTDLFDPERSSWKTFRIRKLALVSELEEALSRAYVIPADRLRLWPIVQRKNSTQRIGSRCRLEPMLGGENTCVMEIAENNNPWNVFLEVLPATDPSLTVPCLTARTTLIFLKLYEPRDRRVYYVGHHFMSENDTWLDLFPMLNERAGYSRDTKLLLFEEVKPSCVSPIEEACLVSNKNNQDELTDGDIIVYQKADKEYLNRFDMPTANEYYKEMYHRIEVLFCDKNVPSDPGFKMVLSQRHTYAEMTARVAERLNTDPECIQFFRTTNYRDCPGNPLRCDTQGTLKDFLSYNKPRMAKKLFYQLLSIKVFELDRKKQIRCVWMSMNCREEKEIVLYPNKNGTVRDLLDEAVASPHVQLVGREGGGTGTLRLLEVAAYKIQSVQRDDAPLESLNVSAQKQFRIEEVPLEEALVAPGELVLPCAHFHKEIYSNFGVPFYVKIREGEKLSSVRERIQKRLEVPEKEFEKWRLALVSGGKAVYLNDEDASIRLDDFVVVSVGTMPSKLWLGLDHVNKAPKKSRYNYLEKAIKIHN